MRFQSIFRICLLVITTATLFSCSKKEEIVSEPLSDYMPLETGKYIVYRLDSLVFTNFGRDVETHRYQIKHEIEAEITDNLGRQAYRVFTYIRDSAGTQSWTANGSYFVTPLDKKIEVLTEDNFRIVKMHLPIASGFSWRGNLYLSTDPYESLNPYNSYDNGMKDWDFLYDGGIEASVSINDQTYTDVLTVEQRNDSTNALIEDPLGYGSLIRSVEKYSKNIGLVYRKYELWEYEPNPSGPSPYYTGFGVTLWMIDHN